MRTEILRSALRTALILLAFYLLQVVLLARFRPWGVVPGASSHCVFPCWRWLQVYSAAAYGAAASVSLPASSATVHMEIPFFCLPFC